MRPVMDADAIARSLRRIAHEIVEGRGSPASVVLAGLPTRGVPLAQRLADLVHEIIGSRLAVGDVDIAPYRDDVGVRSRVADARTHMPVDIAGRRVVLVDDVLHTGRTIRAALDAVADLGRPGRMEVAVLVDRGHREVPIRPDYVGKNLPTAPHERIAVRLRESDGDEGVYIESAVGAEGRRP